MGIRKRVGDLETQVSHHDRRIALLEQGQKVDALLEALNERAS